MQESFFLVKYKRGENVFYCCGDEAEPRHVTAGLVLDYDTIAGADKFGNAFVLRLPTDVSSQVPFLLYMAQNINHFQATAAGLPCQTEQPHAPASGLCRLC